jgi:hypothetical protein
LIPASFLKAAGLKIGVLPINSVRLFTIAKLLSATHMAILRFLILQ